jgi:WD40 repeat protein
MNLRKLFSCILCALLLVAVARAGDGPIAIDTPVRTRPVDFETEVMPILRANCVACHNAKKESGGLNLESVASLAKGGEHGVAIVAGKAVDSVLLKLASHQQKPAMPPAGNKVGARSLTPAELGLVKLWIDQGATAGVSPNRDVRFQSLPAGYQPAFAAAITPDGQYAACSRGNRLFVYHVPTAKLAATLIDPNADGAAHRDIIRSLAFDPAGHMLASGAFREVKLWRRPRLHEIAQWPHEAPLQILTLRANGKLAATGDESGQIRVWDVASGKVQQTIAAHQASVSGIGFSADGATLFSCSIDKTLCVWNVVDGKSTGKPIAAPYPYQGLMLLHRGARLITGDADGAVQIWDAVTLLETKEAKPVRELKAHKKSVTALVAVPGAGEEFFTGGADGFVRRWNASTGQQVRELDNGGPVLALAIRPDGKRLASAGPDYVKLWTDDSPRAVVQLQGDPRLAAKLPHLDGEIALTKALVLRTKQDLKSYEGLERAVTVTADNVKKSEMELTQARKARDDKKATAAKVAAKAPPGDKATLAAEKAVADAETVVEVAVLALERVKATAERTKERLTEAQKRLALNEDLLKKHEATKTTALAGAKASRQFIRSLAFSPDNQRLAVGCDDGVLHLYDAETGAPSESQASHQGAIRALAFAETGRLVSASADRRALVWDTSYQWRLERTIGGPQHPELLIDRVLALDFSRDGKRLATGGGAAARAGELKIWNVGDGRLLSTIPDSHADSIFGVRFSPDGQRIATASADRFIKIFDTTTGAPLFTFTGHTAHVLGVSWKADAKLLVSCGADNVLKLWDPATGAYVRTMKGGIYGNGTYKREIAAVTFVGDSEEILAASGDGSVRLHRASSDNDVMTFTGATGYQYAVAVSADGQSVIAAGSDGVLRLWSGRDSRVKHSMLP